MNNASQNDIEIIKAVLQGDTNSFKKLVDRYQAIVFHIALGFVHDQDEAEDITQEVFIRAWQSLSKFRGDSSFSTWLHKIAINACLNQIRKKNGLPVLNRISSFFISETTEIPPDTENPEEILIREEHSIWLQKALDSLPEKQRIAIVLSKYDDLSQKEIAGIMNLTEGAVEALLQRAKKNLREKLSKGSKNPNLNSRK
jgi:RNA polymerase sigma-70 factor, ECF subfamily